MSEFNPKTIKIGGKLWMAENLNLTDDGLGKDHWKNPQTGEVYYTWEAARRLAKTVSGYHIPTAKEWNQLAEACGCSIANPLERNEGYKNYYKANRLKSKLGIRLFGWYDTYDNIFKNGIASAFWTSTNYETYSNRVSKTLAYGKHFDRTGELKSGTYYKKSDAISVRLVKD